jgi:hypothetical protein
MLQVRGQICARLPAQNALFALPRRHSVAIEALEQRHNNSPAAA